VCLSDPQDTLRVFFSRSQATNLNVSIGLDLSTLSGLVAGISVNAKRTLTFFVCNGLRGVFVACWSMARTRDFLRAKVGCPEGCGCCKAW
jgi:hypothetical protein